MLLNFFFFFQTSTFEVLIGVIHESAETHVASTRAPQRVVKNGQFLYGEGWARERLAKEKIMRGLGQLWGEEFLSCRLPLLSMGWDKEGPQMPSVVLTRKFQNG